MDVPRGAASAVLQQHGQSNSHVPIGLSKRPSFTYSNDDDDDDEEEDDDEGDDDDDDDELGDDGGIDCDNDIDDDEYGFIKRF